MNLEELDVQENYIRWNRIGEMIALIPSKRLKKLKITTEEITQKDLEQVLDALNQHDQPIDL